MSSGFVSAAGDASLAVFLERCVHSGPIVTPSDSLSGFGAARMACEDMVVVVAHGADAEVGVVGDVDAILEV